MMLPTRFALVLAAAALAAGPAAAQIVETLPSSPVPGWSFTPGATIGVVHDSNAILRATAGRSQGLPDQLWTVQPAVALDFYGKYTRFDASYRGNIRRYSSLDALNGYDQRGVIGLTHRATPHVTLRVRDTYSRVPTTDELQIDGIVPFTRTGSATNTLTGSVDTQLSRFTSATFRYIGTWVTFDQQNNLVLRGANVQSVGGDVLRQLSDRLSLGGTFDYRFANLDEGLRQFRFLDTGATVQYRLGPHTSLEGTAGLAHVSDVLAATAKTGPLFRAGLTHQTEHALFGATYQRVYVPSLGFAGSNRSEEARGYVHAPLGRRLYADGSLAWRRSDPLLANVLQLQSVWLSSSIGYEYTRWMRFQGFYRFTRQGTQIPGGEITRHRVGVEAVFSQPMRIQ
jgi:hypothetical protein